MVTFLFLLSFFSPSDDFPFLAGSIAHATIEADGDRDYKVRKRSFEEAIAKRRKEEALRRSGVGPLKLRREKEEQQRNKAQKQYVLRRKVESQKTSGLEKAYLAEVEKNRVRRDLLRKSYVERRDRQRGKMGKKEAILPDARELGLGEWEIIDEISN